MTSTGVGGFGYQGYGQNGAPRGGSGVGSEIERINQIADQATGIYEGALRDLAESRMAASRPPQRPVPAKRQTSSGGLLNGVKQFFKGVEKGATTMLQSLTKPKTWLLIAGAAALTFIFPPAAFALLAIGVLASGRQIYKGLSSSNWEQTGEGVFNLGLSAIGARGTAAGLKAKNARIGSPGFSAQSGKLLNEASTNVTQAESHLALLKNKGGSAEDIAKAQQAVTAAKENLQTTQKAAQVDLARMDALSMARGQQAKHIYNFGPGNLTAAEARYAEASNAIRLKQAELANATGPNAARLQGELVKLESQATNAALSLHRSRVSMQILQMQARTPGQKIRDFGSSTWNAFVNGGRTLANGKITNPYTLETRTLYNAKPQLPGEASAATGWNSNTAMTMNRLPGDRAFRLKDYKQYVWDHKTPALAQGYTAGFPALHVMGIDNSTGPMMG